VKVSRRSGDRLLSARCQTVADGGQLLNLEQSFFTTSIFYAPGSTSHDLQDEVETARGDDVLRE
jgi:hypothetical protein